MKNYKLKQKICIIAVIAIFLLITACQMMRENQQFQHDRKGGEKYYASKTENEQRLFTKTV